MNFRSVLFFRWLFFPVNWIPSDTLLHESTVYMQRTASASGFSATPKSLHCFCRFFLSVWRVCFRIKFTQCVRFHLVFDWIINMYSFWLRFSCTRWAHTMATAVSCDSKITRNTTSAITFIRFDKTTTILFFSVSESSGAHMSRDGCLKMNGFPLERLSNRSDSVYN